MKRKSFVIIAIATLMSLVGCSNGTSNPDDGGSTPPGADTTYTVEFKSSSNDSSRQLASLAGMYDSGEEYIDTAELTRVYQGTKGLKFGGGGTKGDLTLYLSKSIEIKNIVAKIYLFKSTELPSISINNHSSTTSIAADGDFTYDLGGADTDKIEITSNAYKRFYLKSLTITAGAMTPISPTSISMASTMEMNAGGQKTLEVAYRPSNANTNKEITWSTSNSSVATVDNNGIVTIKDNATNGQKVTITATLTNLPSIKASCEITVAEKTADAWTIMLYICGADLESDSQQGGLATSDIAEILSVKRQPEDVNIIIETGGAKSWKTTYGISSSKIGRWEVRNNKLKKVEELSYTSMGEQSTFESFLRWGLGSYPAEKTGVILWNHGGAMGGVCFDEKASDNSLLNSEVDAALTNVLGNQKLEWIGYDACLMQVQDIAEFNSKHFNYMVAAEESEAGEGWDYDTWIDDLYAKKSTTEILKAICDGFVSSVDELYTNEGYGPEYNDQTLSYLDLSYMSQYKSAFDTFTTKVKNVGISKLRTLVKSVKNYADTWVDKSDYNYYINSYNYPSYWFSGPEYEGGQAYYLLHGYYMYGTFDVVDMLNKMKSSSDYSSCTTEINNLLSILDNLIAYSKIGQAAGDSHGLCVVVEVDSSGSFVKDDYVAKETNFTSWRSFVTA